MTHSLITQFEKLKPEVTLTSKNPADQLFDLCAGQGASTAQITRYAPFMESLPATKDAGRALRGRGLETWAEAARAVLTCVVRDNRIGAFSEEAAHFANVCLALDGSTLFLTQRMYGLAHNSRFRYPSSPTTLTERRRASMSHLANVLIQLDNYPCAVSSSVQEAVDEAAAHEELVAARYFAGFNDEEKAEYYRLLTRKYAGAMAVFDKHEPSLSFEDRFDIMITAVVARRYREFYEDEMPSALVLLVEPQLVPDLYDPNSGALDPNTSEAKRTARAMARIMDEIEEQGIWESVLLEDDYDAALAMVVVPS